MIYVQSGGSIINNINSYKIMSKFYKKENGLLIPPEGKSKFNISWNLDNIISGFKKFYEENNRWPLAVDMKICKYLPNVKTLNRKFGGITNIRKELGLIEINLTKGETRSIKAAFLQKQDFNAEQDIYKMLLKVDFLVYHSKLMCFFLIRKLVDLDVM